MTSLILQPVFKVLEKLRQCNAKRFTYRFQCWQCWRVAAIKHIRNCGMRKTGFFCQSVVRPVEMRLIISAHIESGYERPRPGTPVAVGKHSSYRGHANTGGMVELCGREAGIRGTV